MALPLKSQSQKNSSSAPLKYSRNQCIKTVLALTMASCILIPEVHSSLLHRNESNTSNVEALHRLLKVFGMDNPGKRDHRHLPPQYMLDLYNAIADSSGVTRTQHPYKANIVRSFPDKDVGHPQRFYFNFTSSIPVQEQVLQAEFHMFKAKTKDNHGDDVERATPHLYEVRVYQVMGLNSTFTEEGNRLISVRKISTHTSGWEVFYVKAAVEDWIRAPEDNHGLLVTVRNMVGKPADFGLFKVAKHHRHHANKKSILVIFTDDGRRRKSAVEDVKSAGFKSSDDGSQQDLLRISDSRISLNSSLTDQDMEYLDPPLTRSERATTEIQEPNSGCTRHELHVDFEKIGWSSWIISPKWYNAYFCRGDCDFPLGQNQWPTNHATVQSIVHELNLHPGLGTPCCVPSKLYSINLLYFDEHENVILKQYDNMVAASCGCH